MWIVCFAKSQFVWVYSCSQLFALLKAEVAVQYETLSNVKINIQGFIEFIISFSWFLLPDEPYFSWNTAVTSPIKNNSQKYTGRNDNISHLPLESWKELQTDQFCPCSCLLAVSFENILVTENVGNCPETELIYCTLKPQKKMHCRGY